MPPTLPRVLNKLTARKAQSAQPSDKPRKIADGGGLYLLVNPNGSKYWRLKYRHSGKEKLLALGVYPEVSLAQARDRRQEARSLLSDGLDPSAIKRESRHAAAAKATNSFEALAREWHDRQKARWSPGHARHVIDSLDQNVFPKIGHRPAEDISPAELLSVIRAIEDRGALEIASRVLQRCNAVFRYGIASGRIQTNPASDLKGALTAPKQKHYAALRPKEMSGFVKKLEDFPGERKTQLAIKLLMYTFVRTGELRPAEWTEFDFERRLWRVPAERMKMGVEHLVPLSKQALATLEELRVLTGKAPLILHNRSSARTPISENTILFGIYRMGYKGRMTGHGFRSVASTVLNEKGFDSDAIERQLAHGERDKVRAAYNRAKYLPEREKMMQAWADWLETK